MGDEAIFGICKRAFPNHRLLQIPHGPGFERAARIARGPLMCGALLGGGTLVGRARYRLALAEWLRIYPDLPAFALGVGVLDPVFEGIQRSAIQEEIEAWQQVLPRLRLLTVRGPGSQEVLASAGITSTVVGDTALLITRPDRVQVQERLLGLNIGVSARANWIDWAPVLAEVTRFARVMVDRGWRLRLVPMWGADVPFAEHVRREVGRGVEVLRGWDRLPHLLRSIAECHVFTGIKLHSVVFASALGVPSLMLEYDPKCRDFQRSIGRDAFSIPLPTASAPVMLDRVDALAAERDRHSDAICARVEGLRASLRRTIGEIQTSLA